MVTLEERGWSKILQLRAICSKLNFVGYSGLPKQKLLDIVLGANRKAVKQAHANAAAAREDTPVDSDDDDGAPPRKKIKVSEAGVEQ